MKADIGCRVVGDANRVSFTWAEGPSTFDTYVLTEGSLRKFRSRVAESRDKLAAVVDQHLLRSRDGTSDEELRKACWELAQAGHALYLQMFRPGGEKQQLAERIQRWLIDLRDNDVIETLEFVTDGPDSIPWNIIYDVPPEPKAFESALNPEGGQKCWEHFWGLRFVLASGRQVEPLRRIPWIDRQEMRVVLAICPKLLSHLPQDQQDEFNRFVVEWSGKVLLEVVHTRSQIQDALKKGRPHLLYFFCHASPQKGLYLGDDEPLAADDLGDLLQGEGRDGYGGLVFLNACQTAEDATFQGELSRIGLSGIIGTEQETISTFAHPFGLRFLQLFLSEAQPLGSIMRDLRCGGVPLGLLYGTYCPPGIWVRRPGDLREPNATFTVAPSIYGEKAGVAALRMNIRHAPITARAVPPAPLPAHPYRSLSYYDRADRALFAGRDEDVGRFALILDQPATRLMVLHGDSGVGKSSFLRAGLIPYLEEECVGYRFLSETADGGVESTPLFVRATDDLVGQVARALGRFIARPIEIRNPLNETIVIDLAGSVNALLGQPASADVLRDELAKDPTLLGKILAQLSALLPHILVLVVDQSEEIFTLGRANRSADRRHVLDMLRETAQTDGTFKIILALRTEYYGRLVDGLRRGTKDLSGVREYFLTDLGLPALVDAITRPTLTAPIAHSSEIPGKKYEFSFATGYSPELPEYIAREALNLRTNRGDGVLPTIQIICTQLYEKLTDGRIERVITAADLGPDAVARGMRDHVETQIARMFPGGERNPDRAAFRALLTDLYLVQPDGSLTTALADEETLSAKWRGRSRFADVTLWATEGQLRLLRVNQSMTGDGQEKRSLSLGHDALARVAHEWKQEIDRTKAVRKFIATTAASLALAVVMLGLTLWAKKNENRAKEAEHTALTSQRIAQQETKISRGRLARQYMAEARGKIEQEDFLGSLPWLVESLTLDENTEREKAHRMRLGAILRGVPRLEAVWRLPIDTAHPLPQNGFSQSPATAPVRPENPFQAHTASRFSGGAKAAHASENQSPTAWPSGFPQAVAFSPAAELVLILWSPSDLGAPQLDWGDSDNRAGSLWLYPVGELATRSPTLLAEQNCVQATFSPDGRFVAAAFVESTTDPNDEQSEIRILQSPDFQQPIARYKLTTHVDKLVFSPDSMFLATINRHDQTQLLKLSQQELQTVPFGPGEAFGISHAVFSPDSRHLLTASSSGDVRLWNLTDSNEATLRWEGSHGRSGGLIQASFNLDGTIAATSHHKTVCLWNVDTGDRVKEIPCRNEVRMAVITPDSQLITAGSDGSRDTTPRTSVWTIPGGVPVTSLGRRRHKTLNTDLAATAFDGKSESVLTVHASRVDDKPVISARIWNAETGLARNRPVQLDLQSGESTSEQLAQTRVWASSFGKDGNEFRLVSISEYGSEEHPQAKVHLFNPTSSIALKELDDLNHNRGSRLDEFWQVIFSPDGGRVGVLQQPPRTEVATLGLWNAEDGIRILTPPIDFAARHLVFDDLGQRLLVWGGPPKLIATKCHGIILNPANGEEVDSFEFPEEYLIYNIAICPGGSQIATVGYERQRRRRLVRIYDLPGSRLVKEISLEQSETGVIIKYSTDSSRLMIASSGVVRIYPVKQQSHEETTHAPQLFVHGSTINTIWLDSAADIMATAGVTMTIQLWDALGDPAAPPVALDTPLQRLTNLFGSGHFRVLGANLQKPSMTRLMSGMTESTETDMHTRPPSKSFSDGWQVSISVDGRLALIRADNDQARLWDIQRNEAIGTPLKHKNLSRAEFSPDGQRVITLGLDGLARLWNLAPMLPQVSSLQSHPDLTSLLGPRFDATESRVRVDTPIEILDMDLTPDNRPIAILQEMSELLGLIRITESAFEVPDADRVVELYGKLRKHDPGQFQSTDADADRWSSHQAAESEKAGLWIAAITHLRRLVARHPDSWELHVRLGRVQSLVGDFQGADKSYGKALHLNREEMSAWCVREISACEHASIPHVALPLYNILIDTTPDNRRLMEGRGQAWAELASRDSKPEHWKQALSDFERALELGVESISLNCDRAAVRLATGDLQGYQKDCAELVKRSAMTPSDELDHRIAWVLSLSPESGVDESILVRIAEDAEGIADLEEFRLTRPLILIHLGKHDEATQVLKQIYRDASWQNEMQSWRGQLALSSLSDAMKKIPDSPESRDLP